MTSAPLIAVRSGPESRPVWYSTFGGEPCVPLGYIQLSVSAFYADNPQHQTKLDVFSSLSQQNPTSLLKLEGLPNTLSRGHVLKARMPLTAAELEAHPRFKNVVWNLKPDLKGRCKVAENRGGPVNIAYEVHGRGPVRITVSQPFCVHCAICLVLKPSQQCIYSVYSPNPTHTAAQWIMGLACPMWYWQTQCQYFGHGQGDKYSCLILDNRGMGESEEKLMWTSTSEMARDTWEVIDHVGWSGGPNVHVVGASMGGMIALEMVGYMIVSTAA